MPEETIYKVRTVTDGKKVIAMPIESHGFYIRRVCADGAVTFLPVVLPEKEREKQPISCQEGTPLGEVPPRPKTSDELRKLKEDQMIQEMMR